MGIIGNQPAQEMTNGHDIAEETEQVMEQGYSEVDQEQQVCYEQEQHEPQMNGEPTEQTETDHVTIFDILL